MPANKDPKTGKWNVQFYYDVQVLLCAFSEAEMRDAKTEFVKYFI